MSPKSKAPNVKDVDPLSFGGQLRRFREEAGLSQEELGEAIGLNQQRVSLYERNINVPSEDVIVNLAEALKVPAGVLFETTRFNGAIIVGTERRERLKHVRYQEWETIDRYLDGMDKLTPEQRDRFDRGVRNFFETWDK